MNTRLLPLALVALSLGLPSLSANPRPSPETTPTGDYDVVKVNFGPGASSARVRAQLGRPDATLGPDLWIYWNFGNPHPYRANPEHDTLVVAFERNRVVAVKIADGQAVRRLLASAGPGPAIALRSGRAERDSSSPAR